MSLSNDESPASFDIKSSSFDYQNEGARLSNHVRDINNLVRFRRLSLKEDISLVAGKTSSTQTSFVPDSTIPSLYLDINPKSLAIAMNKANNDSLYTRAGFVPQFWGEELDTISVQGTTAAFVHEEKGITRQEAKDTVGYQNFIGLLLLYKNNGANFRKSGQSRTDATYFSSIEQSSKKTLSALKASYKLKKQKEVNAIEFITSSPRKIIDTRFILEMKYLDLLCYGFFDSFQYTESADKPFHFDYSFEFVVLFYNTDKDVRIEGHVTKKK